MSQIPKEDQCVCKKDTPKVDNNSTDIKVVAIVIGALFTTYWWLS
ncbi:9936_t:CDS:1, partial [Dentiscutata heterogama]